MEQKSWNSDRPDIAKKVGSDGRVIAQAWDDGVSTDAGDGWYVLGRPTAHGAIGVEVAVHGGPITSEGRR
ncbi:hypothetical protein [Nocardia sp. NPDC058497]|uniref:hypothetical protein n=1 Tax=Nocardia sp. NPDC058497 TaxID=3346529 RepID=UPI0036479445